MAKLKMPGILEAVNFSHLVTPQEVYERLVDLDQRIVLRWIIPGKPGAEELGPPGSTKYRVWVRPKNSTNVKILGGGHLVRFDFFFFLFCYPTPTFFFLKFLLFKMQLQIAQEAPQELGMLFQYSFYFIF